MDLWLLDMLSTMLLLKRLAVARAIKMFQLMGKLPARMRTTLPVSWLAMMPSLMPSLLCTMPA